jgi:hypothetical protein
LDLFASFKGYRVIPYGALTLAAALPFAILPAHSLGVVAATHPAVKVHLMSRSTALHGRPIYSRKQTVILTRIRQQTRTSRTSARTPQGRTISKLTAAKKAKEKAVAAKPLQPQNYFEKMVSREVAPGVVHKYFRGPLSINLLDVDMAKAPVKVQPYLFGSAFNNVDDVAEHAKQAKAIAAINANYFKRKGIPLCVDGHHARRRSEDRPGQLRRRFDKQQS